MRSPSCKSRRPSSTSDLRSATPPSANTLRLRSTRETQASNRWIAHYIHDGAKATNIRFQIFFHDETRDEIRSLARRIHCNNAVQEQRTISQLFERCRCFRVPPHCRFSNFVHWMANKLIYRQYTSAVAVSRCFFLSGMQ